MRTQTRRPPEDPACRPGPAAPWASLSLREQHAFLESLGANRDRQRFLETEANRLLGMGRSENFQRNADFRAEHTDGRPLFEEFDGDTNNAEDEPSELNLDALQILDDGAADGEAAEAPISQDPEESLTSSWVDCAAEDALWGINEWNAVASMAPASLRNRDVLVGLARGLATAEIAKLIGRTPRQVRNAKRSLWKYVRTLDVAEVAGHLDDPDTIEDIARRPPSRAGRKPRVAAITTGVVVDLWGAHHQPQRRGRGPDRAPRRPRARPVCKGQLAFDWAA